MEIYLIRHTQPLIDKGVCYGQSDVPLIKGSENEFAITQKKLSITPDLIYSSPLTRCYNLAKYLGEKIKKDDHLKELNFGEWELKKWDDIDQEELRIWMNNFVSERCPKGESYEDLFKRVNIFWNQLLLARKKRVVIVTHAGVIRAILSLILEIPLHKSFNIEIHYGSISKLLVKENNCYVISTNR